MKFLITLFFCFAFSLASYAQQTIKKVDHLTVEEDDLVHEAQELDKRVEIYVKVIDRRFSVLNPANENSSKKKEAKEWGALPSGTPAELLGDIKHVLEEAVRNIDNGAERDAKSLLLPKALKTLADGCSRFVVQLKALNQNAQTEFERAAILDSLQNCQEVLQAQAQQEKAKAPE